MNRMAFAIARLALGLSIVCATLVSSGSSASADQDKYVQIVSGGHHVCGILVSRRVKCWGYNQQGQLGLGHMMDDVSSATLVPDLSAVESLVLGMHHTCAVLTGGAVKCWGYNIYGQLGLGSAGDSVAVPSLVSGLSDVQSLVLGSYHSCAVLVSGAVKCWGRNYFGELGLGYYGNQSVSSPTLVPGLSDVRSVVLGGYHSCAVLYSGEVKCWGYNLFGQLGLGSSNTDTVVSSPTVVSGLSDMLSVVLGGYNSCAVLSSGEAKCWGYNYDGQVGLGYSSQSVRSPTVVPELTGVVSLNLGGLHACAVVANGSVKCWGNNYEGELGLGYANADGSRGVSSPTVVPALTDVATLSLGDSHSCAVLVSGSVKCWGYNYDGQLGLTYTSHSSPWGLSSPAVVPGVSFRRGLAAPTSLAATSVGGTSVTVKFTNPSDTSADDPITAFEYSIDGGSTWIAPNVPVTASPLTISGLDYATAYSIKIRAVNSQGPGDPTDAISVTTLAMPASAPSISSVVTGAGRGTLKISAPSVLGDRSLIGYDYSTNNGSTWLHFASVDGPFVITGLTNGTAYQVKVRAVNSTGPGAASDAVTVNPTKLVPAIPAITSIARGDGQAIVNVKPPTDVTAQSITGYQYNLNSGALWNPVTLTNGSFTVTGLTNGSNYAIKIRAANVNGLSGLSGKVSVTPMTTATASTIQSIKSLNGALTVTFGGIINNGGSVAKNYQYSLNGGSTWNDCVPALKLGPTMTIKGLTNGTSYQVAIRMVNGVGPGAASNVVAGTPATTPSAPLVSSALVGKTSATLTLGTFATGGTPITGYAYSFDNKTWTSVTPLAGQFTVSGLKTFTTYKIYVRASNLVGNGLVASTTVKTLK